VSSVALLVADLVSYLPEAIGSSADMKARLERPRTIVVLSLVVAAACALAWVVTRVLPCEGRAVLGAVDGFAAGASLLLLVGSRSADSLPSCRSAGR
jgi:hypothetical protein